MTDSDRPWGEEIPADLVATSALAVVTTVLVVVDVPVVQVVFGLAFTLFAPGYVFVSVLYPAAPGRETDDPHLEDESALAAPARARLSVAMSLALLPPLALALSVLPVALAPLTLVVALAVVVVAGAAAAALRRSQLPPDARYRPIRPWQSVLPGADTKLDTVLDVALAISVVLAASGLAYALAAPGDGETYADFALRTENESGDLVASGFPEEVATGESAELVAVVENYEHRSAAYTVVVELQRLDNGSVVEERELDRFEATLDHGETWRESHEIAPTLTGEDLRLNYFLYRGSAPADGSEETAYRTLTLWIDVTERED